MVTTEKPSRVALTLRLPEVLYLALVREAFRRRLSINTMVQLALEDRLLVAPEEGD